MTTTVDDIVRCKKKIKFVEIRMLSYVKGLVAYTRKEKKENKIFLLESW